MFEFVKGKRKEKEREGLETCGEILTPYLISLERDSSCRCWSSSDLPKEASFADVFIGSQKRDRFCIQKRIHQKGYILSVMYHYKFVKRDSR